jgi:hypothetical protein
MTLPDDQSQTDEPVVPAQPVVREGEYEGTAYRIETYHAPEEL